MDVEIKDKASQRHVGRNLQRIRVYLGMKQEALAADLGISQQEISKIEKQDEIEDKLLTQIATALGVSAEVIRDFDVERAIYNYNSYKEQRFLREQQQLFMLIHNKLILLIKSWSCMNVCCRAEWKRLSC